MYIYIEYTKYIYSLLNIYRYWNFNINIIIISEEFNSSDVQQTHVLGMTGICPTIINDT